MAWEVQLSKSAQYTNCCVWLIIKVTFVFSTKTRFVSLSKSEFQLSCFGENCPPDSLMESDKQSRRQSCVDFFQPNYQKHDLKFMENRWSWFAIYKGELSLVLHHVCACSRSPKDQTCFYHMCCRNNLCITWRPYPIRTDLHMAIFCFSRCWL